MNEGVVLLANAIEELLRHQSSLRSTGLEIIIEILYKLSYMGEEGQKTGAEPSFWKARMKSLAQKNLLEE